MSNFSQAIKATETAYNSAGSAAAENEKYMDSLEAKTNHLSATFQDFSSGLISKDGIAGALDIANGALNVLNNGLGQSITLGAGAGAAVLGLATIVTQFGRNLGLIATPMATLMPGIGQAALIIGGLAAAIAAVYKIVQAIKQSNSLVDLQRQFEEDSLAAEQFTKKAEEAKSRLDELNNTPYEERTEGYEAEIEELKEVIAYYEDLAQKRKEAAKEEVAQIVQQDVGTGRYKAYYQYGISGQMNPELETALNREYASETAAIYALAKAYNVEGDSVQELKDKLVAYGFIFNEVMVSASQYQQQMVSEIAGYRNLIAQSSELSDTKRQEIENYLQANKTYVDNLRLLDSLTPAQQAIISGYDTLTEALEANTSGTNGNIGSQTDWLAVAKTRQTLLIEIAKATDGVTQSVYDEISAETVFNNSHLSVDDKIEALRNLAVAAGVSGVLIDNALGRISAIGAKLSAGGMAAEETGYDISDMDRLLAQASSTIKGYIKPTKTSSGTAKTKSQVQTELEGYKQAVNLAKTEAQFAEKSGKSYEKQIAAKVKVQSALHKEADYLRSILADSKKMADYGKSEAEIRAEILALSNEWWDVEKDRLALIEKQNEALKEQLEAEKSALEDYMDTLKAAAAFAADAIQDEIDALDEANDALEEKIALEEREKALAEAQSKRKLVYKDGRFQYVEDIDAIATAQAALDETKRKQALDSRKKQLQEEKRLWTDYASSYDKIQNQLAWSTIFGTKNISDSLQQRLADAHKFAEEYAKVAAEIAAYNEIISGGSYTGAKGTSVGGITVSTVNDAAILKQMEANSLAWHTAADAEKIRLHNENKELASQLGLSFTGASGKWHYATGTLAAAGGLSVVGEHGPEMRVMGRGDGVIPADITKNLWAWGTITPSDFLMGLVGNTSVGGQTIAINGNLTLPNVRDAQSFLSGIKELAMQYTTKR